MIRYIIGIILYFVLFQFKDLRVIQSLLLKRALKGAVTYPRTEILKLAKPLLNLTDLSEFDKENIEIKRDTSLYQLPSIIDILGQNMNDFMLNQVDMIIISRWGMEVLIINMKTSREGRSLIIDLDMVKTNYNSYIHTGIWCILTVCFIVWELKTVLMILLQPIYNKLCEAVPK